MGILLGKPPFNLVQLSTIPKEKWIGLAVFHPFSQMGNEANWSSDDLVSKVTHSENLTGKLVPTTQYDVGVIISFEYDDLARMQRASFVSSWGSVLRYTESNLWVIDPNNPEVQPYEEVAIGSVEYASSYNDEE